MPPLRGLGCRAKRFEPQHIRLPEHRRCDIPVAARHQPHPKLRQERHRTAVRAMDHPRVVRIGNATRPNAECGGRNGRFCR